MLTDKTGGNIIYLTINLSIYIFIYISISGLAQYQSPYINQWYQSDINPISIGGKNHKKSWFFPKYSHLVFKWKKSQNKLSNISIWKKYILILLKKIEKNHNFSINCFKSLKNSQQMAFYPWMSWVFLENIMIFLWDIWRF